MYKKRSIIALTRIKKVLKIFGIILVVIFIAGSIAYLYITGTFKPGNAIQYSVAQTEALQSSPISGKTIYFLGSSVTQGFAAKNESFVDYIQKRNNCTCIKEAVSGTTLLDNGSNSYIRRMYKLNKKAKINVFICQLSTNDARFNKLGKLSKSKNRNDFDTTTTTGAIEFIISYACGTWNCPVVFYTSTYYKDKNYKAIVDRLLEIKNKWEICVIDLYNDKEMYNISKKERNLYMNDYVHPVRAGYKLWWTPVFEKYLYNLLGHG